MRPYGQKRVYGKGITRTRRLYRLRKIQVYTLTKNRKRERSVPVRIED